MSLKASKNLLIGGAVTVVACLLVGTVLLGSYMNTGPARSDAGLQVKACQATGQMSCCLAQNSPGPSDEGCCQEECCPDNCDKCCCPSENCPCQCCRPCCPEKDSCCGGKACPVSK
jgi:hypothetical protein